MRRVKTMEEHKVLIGLASVFGAIMIVVLSLVLSLLPAMLVGGVVHLLTGMNFWQVTLIFWVIAILFGRGR